MLRVSGRDDHRSWGILAGRFRRRIDPDRVRQDVEAWSALHEPLGMRGVGGHAGTVTDLEGRGRAPEMHVGWREIAQAAVMMRVVIPGEEVVADRAGVFEGAEPIRKLRSVLERTELRFG